jgi:hypothetical protein
LVNSFSETHKGMYLPNVEVNPNQTYNDYRKTLAGYSYELAPDWNIYHGSVDENWVSNESNSLALLGLLEFIEAKYKYGYDASYITAVDNAFAENNTLNVANNKLVSKEAMNSIAVYDLMGKIVLKQNKSATICDVSALKSGLYIARATLDNEQIVTLKFIK